MLKYIIIREPTGAEVAFFCLAPTKHLELSLMAQAHHHGRTVVSAGFVDFIYVQPPPPLPGRDFLSTDEDGPMLTAKTYGYSDSLNLRPRPEDAKFLSVFAKQTAAVAAVSMNQLAALSQ